MLYRTAQSALGKKKQKQNIEKKVENNFVVFIYSNTLIRYTIVIVITDKKERHFYCLFTWK